MDDFLIGPQCDEQCDDMARDELNAFHDKLDELARESELECSFDDEFADEFEYDDVPDVEDDFAYDVDGIDDGRYDAFDCYDEY